MRIRIMGDRYFDSVEIYVQYLRLDCTRVLSSYNSSSTALGTSEKSYVTQLNSRERLTVSSPYKFACSYRRFRAKIHWTSNSFETSSAATLANSHKSEPPTLVLISPNGSFWRSGKQTLQKLCSSAVPAVSSFINLRASRRVRLRPFEVYRICEIIRYTRVSINIFLYCKM